MSTVRNEKDDLYITSLNDGKDMGECSKKGELPQKDGHSRGEDDFLDLLGRIPGKVSSLQEEIDRMKKKQNR